MDPVPAEGISSQSKRTRRARWDPDEEYIDTSPALRQHESPKRTSSAPPRDKLFHDLSASEREKRVNKIKDIGSLWGCNVFQCIPNSLHPRIDEAGNRRPKVGVKATPISDPRDLSHNFLSALARLAELTQGNPEAARKLLTSAVKKRRNRQYACAWGWDKVPELILLDINNAVEAAGKSDAVKMVGEGRGQAGSAAGRRSMGREARNVASGRGSLDQGTESANVASYNKKEPESCLYPEDFRADTNQASNTLDQEKQHRAALLKSLPHTDQAPEENPSNTSSLSDSSQQRRLGVPRTEDGTSAQDVSRPELLTLQHGPGAPYQTDTRPSSLYGRNPGEIEEMDDEELNCRLEELNCRLEIERLKLEKKRREKVWRAIKIKAESSSSARDPISLDD